MWQIGFGWLSMDTVAGFSEDGKYRSASIKKSGIYLTS
jgi:hypothetical protein